MNKNYGGRRGPFSDGAARSASTPAHCRILHRVRQVSHQKPHADLQCCGPRYIDMPVHALNIFVPLYFNGAICSDSEQLSFVQILNKLFALEVRRNKYVIGIVKMNNYLFLEK